MNDVEQIWSNGWVPCERVADAITEAKTELDALWPRGGSPPDRRDVIYLLDSLRLGLYKRAVATRVGTPPPQVGSQQKPQTSQAISATLGRPIHGAQWTAPIDTPLDSRAEYQTYRSTLHGRAP